MTVLFTDDFERPDGAYGDGLGGDWLAAGGDTLQPFWIEGGQATEGGATDSATFALQLINVPGFVEGAVETHVTTIDDAFTHTDILVNYVDDDNFMVVHIAPYVSTTEGICGIYTMIAGVFDIGAMQTPWALIHGVSLMVRVAITDSEVKVNHNGNELIYTLPAPVEAVFAGATGFGIARPTGYPQTTYYEDFSVVDNILTPPIELSATTLIRVRSAAPGGSPLNPLGVGAGPDLGRGTWRPIATIDEEWGRIQVVIDGVDVTYYGMAQAIISDMTFTEPFGPAVMTVVLPAQSSFVERPNFLGYDFPNIEVWRVDISNNRVGTHAMWEGFVAAYEDVEPMGYRLECVGAIMQADFFVKPPAFNDQPTDVGVHIANLLNEKSSTYGLRVAHCAPVTTGINTRNRGSWQPLLTGYIQDLLGTAMTAEVTGGTTLHVPHNQWTLMCDPGRQPVIRLKDRTTVHWSVRYGTPGVELSGMKYDRSQSPTTIFAEGISLDNCRWRNTKYPNLRTDDAPVFSGTLFTIGVTHDDVGIWKTEMRDNGWPVTESNTYTAHDAQVARDFQTQAGIQVDGVVGPQTWAATFDVGSNAGDLSGAFFLPLLMQMDVEPYLYNPKGGILGTNPIYNPRIMRRERYENFGERIEKGDALVSCADEWVRENSYPNYNGTITLTIDPYEASRFNIRAGQNINLIGYRGINVLFHISAVTLSFDDLTATLTVDTLARDFITLSAIQARNREANDPVKRERTYQRASRQVEDRIAVWDCENGGGVLPRHATYAGLWIVSRIPAGEVGSIIRCEFQAESAARFSVAIFDRPISANELNRLVGGPESENYWVDFPEDLGLMVSWGGAGNMGGYYPDLESHVDPISGEIIATVTGRLVDNGTMYYQSTEPPYLWVAECLISGPTINYFSGRLFPGFA